MKKIEKKSLTLSKETVRALVQDQLSDVAGGQRDVSYTTCQMCSKGVC